MQVATSVDLDRGRIASELRAVCKRIASDFEPSEAAFMEIGRELQDLCMAVEALTTATTEAAERAGSSLSEQALPEIKRVSEALFADLDEDSARVEESLRSLTGISSALDELQSATAFLRSVAKRLNTIRIYVEIESSRSEATIAAFVSFGAEMSKLGELVLQTCGSLTEDEKAARDEQIHSRSEIDAGLQSTRKLSASAEETARRAQCNVQAFLKQTAETLESATAHSSKIGESVDEMVRSLQFHDIVRQQLEHVVEALSEASGLMEGAGAGPESDLDRAVAILRLQEEHVRDAVASIASACNVMEREFERSRSEVGALVRDLPYAATDGAKHCGQETFEELLDNAHSMVELHARAQNLEERSAQSAATMACASSSLGQHVDGVRRISGEMELRALNAAVKSARLGQEGLTLKVLADEVTKLSNGSAHFVESTIETLNRITSATAAMTNCVDADGQTADRSRDLNALLATVRAAYDGLASACTAISARAGELQERICRRASVLEFLASYSERLSAEAALLERLRKEIAPYAPNPELSLQSDERRLADRYTMESERDVFRKLTSVEQAAGDDELAVEQGGCILF